MLIYEIFEAIKFRCDYAKILGLINSSDKLVLKNKPDKQYYIDYNSFGSYKDIVKEFVKEFKYIFPKEQVNNLLSNLESLKIKTVIPNRTLVFSNYKSLATYNSKNNEIIVETNNEKHIKNTLYHELLHVASRRVKENEYYCGFDIKNIIGIGINEDYTEYLLEKYFKEEPEYDRRAIFIQEIENLIGEDKLEEIYFNADLPSLIKELSKITNKKEVIKLLYEYDALYNITYSNGLYYKVETKIDSLSKQKEKVKEYVL